MAGAAFASLATAAGPEDARWSQLVTTIFHNYGRDNGLPHPVPTALAQDQDGFIWIGTQGGLARWDGYRFRTYRADPERPGSLHDDWIEALHVDARGRLWVGGGAGGLAYYDAMRDRFVRVRVEPTTGRVHIAKIVDDGRSGLWIATDTGLHHISPYGRGAFRFPPALVERRPVRALLRQRDGTLWIGTTEGLFRSSASLTTRSAVPLPGVSASISALFEDERGQVWIGTARNGLFVVDAGTTAARRVNDMPVLRTSWVSSIIPAGPDEIWVALRGTGIAAIDGRTRKARMITHDRAVPGSLAHNDVWALLRDKAGSLWAGSTGGLSYRPQTAGLISTIVSSPENPKGLSAPDAFSILAARNGRIWMGYVDGGVDVIDPVEGRVAAIRPSRSGSREMLPPDVVFGLAEAATGRVYVGTRRGLYFIEPGSWRVRHVQVPGESPELSINAVRFDGKLLWIGTDERGLIGFVPDPSGTQGRVVFGGSGTARLADGGINAILRGAGTALWVGARNGLYRIDVRSHAIEHIMADPNDPNGLPARFVVTLLTDRKGRLWVGTFGGGLAMVTGRDAAGKLRFRRIGVSQGLPHVNVDTLQMDGDGTIWAGTDDGLARIDAANFTARSLRQADGSSLIDYFASAGATTPQGEALFGAKGGMTIVRPGDLPPWTLQPALVVTDLRVGGIPLPIARVNASGQKDAITIAPDANSIAVEFAALDFSAPERNRYAYRLEGFDQRWTETDAERRLAIYTNLPPGNFVLRIRGTNRAGLWSEHELALPIRVLPTWYQRWWARLGAALLLIGLLGMTVRWRTRYLQKRQIALERQIAERTADLSAANESLARMAMTDPLTGCANRRHFMAVAEDYVDSARREGMPLSLLVIDLDEFKALNDRLGHPGGDAVLGTIGALLLRQMQPGDVAGRIGGEEFAILLPNCPADEAARRAETIRTAIREAVTPFGTSEIRITASLGVSSFGAGDDFSSMYMKADAALYAAKGGGRDRVRQDERID
ncbi:MAG: ligand-binding sensor domain-containing diguanylate cyclase [Pseudomonadota bacterium]